MCIYSAASIIPFTLHHYMGVALPAVQLPACLAMVPSLTSHISAALALS